MKHLAWAFLFVCGMSMPVLSAPLYRAGEAGGELPPWLHGEVSADYQFSSQKMETKQEDATTSSLHGWNVRALWTPLSWLSVGAEMGKFGDKELKEVFISSYETSRWAGIVKLTLSPNTSPRVYVVAGYGQMQHQLNYDHAADPLAWRHWPASEKKSTSFWMAGLGVEVTVWKMLFVGMEGNLLRHQTMQLARIYKTNSKIETVLRLRAGVRL